MQWTMAGRRSLGVLVVAALLLVAAPRVDSWAVPTQPELEAAEQRAAELARLVAEAERALGEVEDRLAQLAVDLAAAETELTEAVTTHADAQQAATEASDRARVAERGLELASAELAETVVLLDEIARDTYKYGRPAASTAMAMFETVSKSDDTTALADRIHYLQRGVGVRAEAVDRATVLKVEVEHLTGRAQAEEEEHQRQLAIADAARDAAASLHAQVQTLTDETSHQLERSMQLVAALESEQGDVEARIVSLEAQVAAEREDRARREREAREAAERDRLAREAAQQTTVAAPTPSTPTPLVAAPVATTAAAAPAPSAPAVSAAPAPTAPAPAASAPVAAASAPSAAPAPSAPAPSAPAPSAPVAGPAPSAPAAAAPAPAPSAPAAAPSPAPSTRPADDGAAERQRQAAERERQAEQERQAQAERERQAERDRQAQAEREAAERAERERQAAERAERERQEREAAERAAQAERDRRAQEERERQQREAAERAAASTQIRSGPSANLRTVGGITVAASLAPNLQALLDHARRDGIVLGGSGYRSPEITARLRLANGCPDVYTSPPSACRVPTAIPGSSEHEKGLAVDFTFQGQTICFPLRSSSCSGNRAFDWLRRNASTYGFYNLPSEAWHWSTTGR
jgi:zinc D-Ala-D-Ala carboxypeptidase